jgi:hypothetical protein
MVRLPSPARWQEWADRMERFERSGRSSVTSARLRPCPPGRFGTGAGISARAAAAELLSRVVFRGP